MTRDTPTPHPGPRAIDAGALLLFALATMALRLPTLEAVALNPDESQYEATAAWLVAHGRSAFELPYGTGGALAGTLTLFRAMTRLFGPYPMLEVRVLVMLLVVTMATLAYVVVRRLGSPWGGLLAGIVLIHLSIPFEGYSANREWFSAAAILASIAVVASIPPGADPRRRAPALFAAGLLSGAAAWFKLQALPLLLALPLLVLCEAVASRRASRLRDWLPVGAGLAAAGSLFLLPYALHGRLLPFLGGIVGDLGGYVVANEADTRAAGGGGLAELVHRLYVDLPFRPLFLAGWAFTGATLFNAVRRAVRPPDRDSPDESGRRVALLVALNVLAAAVAVQMGRRFFEHYFLLLVPPMALALGLLARAALRRPAYGGLRGAAPWLALGAALAVDQIVDLGWWTPARAMRGVQGWLLNAGHAWPGLLLLAGMLGLAVAVAWRPAARARSGVVLLLALLATFLTIQIERSPRPRSLPNHPAGFAALTSRIAADAAPGDRLFVWGWLPELYSLTRLVPASHVVVVQFVVGDYEAEPDGPRLDRALADRMMAELLAAPPRFIVDASRRSWTLAASGDPWLYDLDRYPRLGLHRLLERDYDPVAVLDDCELWERRPATALVSAGQRTHNSPR